MTLAKIWQKPSGACLSLHSENALLPLPARVRAESICACPSRRPRRSVVLEACTGPDAAAVEAAAASSSEETGQPYGRRSGAEKRMMSPSPRQVGHPPRTRGVVCAALLAVILAANHFCRDLPGTLEEQLADDDELRVSNRRFATLTAAYFLPSAFVPLALGMLSSIPSEQGGVRSETTFVAVATVASLGNVLAAVGVQMGSFGTLLAGRSTAGAVYEAVDMTPLGFMPQLLPELWGTTSGFINGMLRLGSVAAFAGSPVVYADVGGGGREGTVAVFWSGAAVGAVMWPLALVVRWVALGRADACPNTTGGGARADEQRASEMEKEGKDNAREGKEGAQVRKERAIASVSECRTHVAAYASVRHAVASVPRIFWAYAAAGTFMYASVIPFWFYGAGFLQRFHGFSVNAADTLMVVPELTLAVLSIPIGIVVDTLGLSLRVQQLGFTACAALIAVSHALLATGFNPTAGVIGLGLGYATCNQLMWAGFPSVCPREIMSLGAGFVACFINLGCTLMPALVGTVRGKSEGASDTAMFLLFSASALCGAVLASMVARGVFEGDGGGTYVAVQEEDWEKPEVELGRVKRQVLSS